MNQAKARKEKEQELKREDARKRQLETSELGLAYSEL